MPYCTEPPLEAQEECSRRACYTGAVNMINRAITHSSFRSIATTIGLTALFIVATGWILLVANGYVVNPQTFSLQQRAAIALAGLPPQVSVTLDGQIVSQKLPVTLRDILPGQHGVRISAPGLQDWHLSARLSSGQAVVRDSILLFRAVATPISDNLPNVPVISLIDPNLTVSGGELAQLVGGQRQLITRFSQPVLAARISSDREHVYVQLGNQIFVTELDGANTTPLVTLDDATPVIISPSGRDSVLAIRRGSVVQAWTIR
mgnify:CR=1 FL=1